MSSVTSRSSASRAVTAMLADIPTGIYFVVCMALLVISLTETILIVRLVHKQDLQPHVPHWVKHLLLERATVILSLDPAAKLNPYSCEDPRESEAAEGVRPTSEGSVLAHGVLREVTAIRQFMRNQCGHHPGKCWRCSGSPLHAPKPAGSGPRALLAVLEPSPVDAASPGSHWQTRGPQPSLH